MKRNFRGIGIVVLLLSLVGCTTRLVDFTMISTKNFDLSQAQNFERARTRVQGKDEAMIIIIIPTGYPSIKEAVDRAIESVPGAVALVDGVLYQQAFWLIIGTSSYIVEGTPLIDTSLAASEFQSPYMIAKMDRKGKVKDFRYVSSDEYKATKQKYMANHRQVKL